MEINKNIQQKNKQIQPLEKEYHKKLQHLLPHKSMGQYTESFQRKIKKDTPLLQISYNQTPMNPYVTRWIIHVQGIIRTLDAMYIILEGPKKSYKRGLSFSLIRRKGSFVFEGQYVDFAHRTLLNKKHQ